ncbi:MAG: type II toxin-antitoxin system PemK/MazF family toxin [Candidatus Falkowbacteria bacterium]|nr:type II toxin-antitoxin system PemK/MazF family toxin [Candidatus Falkowbacteria bacterium]
MEEYLVRFVLWTKLKIRLHLKPEREVVYFKERDIWWTSIGVNISHEEYGKKKYFERPVLILRKINRNIFWGVPMTSKDKIGKYYVKTKFENKNYYFILSQLRAFSSKRLSRKIRRIPEKEFTEIKNSIKNLL